MLSIDTVFQLETVSIAEPLQNRQHPQNPSMLKSRYLGREEARRKRQRREGGTV